MVLTFVDMIAAHMERFATPAGLRGNRAKRARERTQRQPRRPGSGRKRLAAVSMCGWSTPPRNSCVDVSRTHAYVSRDSEARSARAAPACGRFAAFQARQDSRRRPMAGSSCEYPSAR